MSEGVNWYLNKENIMPLPEGRRSADVLGFFSNVQTISESFIISEHEEQLANCLEAEVPDKWLEYVIRIEQKNVSNGKPVLSLLERSLKSIGLNKSYYNNRSYFTLWNKYAKMSEKQLEIYAFMLNNEIGTCFITFYHSWAHALEINGFYGKAKHVYKIGINRNLKDVDKLLKYHNCLCVRMRELKKAGNKIDESDLDQSSNHPSNQTQGRRRVFGSLVEVNEYEECMDRVANYNQAQPLKAETKEKSQGTKALNINSVFKTETNSALSLNNLISCEEKTEMSLKDSWSKPYITSKIDSDNILKSNSWKPDFCLPPVKSLRQNSALGNQNDANNQRKLNIKISHVYCETVEFSGGSKSVENNDKCVSEPISFNTKNRVFVFKLRRKPDISQHFPSNVRQNQPLAWVLAPELDYAVENNVYSFEELIAARYKKLKRPNPQKL